MSYIYEKQHQQQDLFWWDIQVILWENFDTNRLVQLAEEIDRELYYDAFNEAYSMSWRWSLPVRQMFWLELLKHIWKWVSDEYIVEQLRTNVAVMRFCGYKNIYTAKMHAPKSASSMTHFRNRVSEIPWLVEKIQKIHLKNMVRHVPKKRRKQFDMDSTVIDESVTYPNDVDLLASICEKGGKLLDKAKKVWWDLVEGIIVKGRRIAKKLKYSYHFWWRKKEKLKEIREKVAEIWEKVIETVIEAKNKLKESSKKEYKKLIKKMEKMVEVWSKIIEQQKEMIRTWTNRIADRIVSLSKEYVRPIVKGKVGKKVQFWSKVQIWMIWKKLACVVSVWRDNEHDSKSIKKWIELFEEVNGKPPWEFWADKGYREKSGESYEYMKENKILNGIQWTKEFNSLDKKTRKRLYNRRAFTEPMIGNIKWYRWCNINKHKKGNVIMKLIMGSMASNYLRVY